MSKAVTSYNLITTSTIAEQAHEETSATLAEVKLGKFNLRRITPPAIFVFSLLLNLVTVRLKNFDGLYGQDAYSYFAYAGELYQHQSLFHHWQWEATSSILYWPFGYSGLAAIFFTVTGPTASGAQLVSIVTWAGVAALVAAIGQRLWTTTGWLAGTVAGLLVALSPLGRQLAVSVMSDAAALFWTLLAIWLTFRASARTSANSEVSPKKDTGVWVWAVGVGIAFGLAILTRYSAITALPLIPLILLRQSSSKDYRKIVFKCILIFGIAALIYLPQLIINQLYPDRFWYNSWLDNWTPLNAFQTSFATRDGLASYASPPLAFYLFYTMLNPHFFTPLIILPAGLGLIFLWRRRKDRPSQNRFSLLVLLAWWLVPALLFSTFIYESERYSLTFMPPIALLAGLGTAKIWHWLRLKPLFWQRAGLLAAVGLLAGLAILSQKHLSGFIADKNQSLAVVQQVEQVVPAKATLITFDISLTFDHYTSYTVRDLWYLDPTQIKGLVTNSASTDGIYLLADPANMRQQWTGNHVGEAFQAASGYIKGTPLGQFGRFWLWKLGAS